MEQGMRCEYVRKIIMSTWDYYVKYSFIRERSLYLQSSKGWYGMDSVRNVLSSMSTLWMIGNKAQFLRAEVYVMEKLNFSKLDDEIIVSQVITDYLGSLLSIYALTQKQWYLDKAKELADILQKAYDSPSGLPYWKINLKTKAVNGIIVSLSDCYNGALEYNYLSSLTGDEKYKARIITIRNLFKVREWPQGCHMSRRHVETGQVWGTQAQLFNGTRDFYFTLVKEWYQSGKRDHEARDMYREAMEELIKPSSLVVMTSHTGQKFLQCCDPYNMFMKNSENQMWYDGCYVGAMWSLSAQMLAKPSEGEQVYSEQAKQQMDLAISVTQTCVKSHNATATKLAPRKFYFTNSMDGTNIFCGPYDKQYHLTQEMAETYFIMWRLTHDEQYRTGALEMVEAINEHCRSPEGGYSSIKRVDVTPTEQIEIYPPHWISGTLKFLYLIFCKDTVYPLDQWVFNATGQLLPIRGRHPTYPALPTTGAGPNNTEPVTI